MKARTRKTRWLLIALLFGLLAAAGLTFTRHHARTFVAANVPPAPRVVLPQPHAVLLASIGGKHTLWTPAGALPDDGATAQAYSNNQQPPQTHSGAPSNTSTATSAARSSAAAVSAGTSSTAAQPSNQPATAAGNLPQPGAGEYAYNGYVPLDCELPAGCGAAQSTAIVSRQPSGTSGGTPGAHDSGSVPGDGSGNNDPPNNNQNSDPPSKTDPPVAAAPELDPATLAGAVTLLLGSLAVLRSRRGLRVSR